LAKSLIISFQYNIESAYFFSSNPVLLIIFSNYEAAETIVNVSSHVLVQLLHFTCKES